MLVNNIKNFERIDTNTKNTKYKETLQKIENGKIPKIDYIVLINHLKCILKAKLENLDKVIIMEDDVSFELRV